MNQSKVLFIGYCSLPVSLKQSQRNKFLEDQIGTLFNRYKKILRDNSPLAGDYSNDLLFTPTYYYLWGKYDVCVLSEIDDLEFPTRFFRPFNPILNQVEPSGQGIALENFDYKVISGIGQIKSDNYSCRKLPYIAISQLKINSAFLLGNGLVLVSSIVNKITVLIQLIIDKRSKNNISIDIQYKITESFSYHELIVVLHSNSLYALKEVVTEIRCLNIESLGNVNTSIISNSIVSELISENGDEIEATREQITKKGSLTNHLFESTHSTFGVHQDVYDSPISEWENEDKFGKKGIPFETEKFRFLSRWNIKSGHCKMVYDSLTKQADSGNVNDFFTIAGRGDIMLTYNATVDSTVIDGTNPLLYPRNLFNNDEQLSYHVVETFTTIGFDYTKSNEEIDFDTHKNIHKNLGKFQIRRILVEDVIEAMRSVGVPKVLSEKVLKLISNYNNAVLNPDMYASFVELYFYITNNLLNTIREYGINNSMKQFNTRVLIEKLEAACSSLDASFQNRFYQSYWMAESIEVNIDYSGGVHNLISAYDSCFKTLNNNIRSANKDSAFVYIKSDHTVYAYAESLILNYLHITQPYIYCAISIYETLNFIVEKWYHSSRFNDAEDSFKDKALTEILTLLHEADIPFKANYVNSTIEKNVKKTPKILSSKGPLKELDNSLGNKEYDLLMFVNSKTFRYFITDYVNYKSTYKSDFSLFCKTTWFYIVQLGNIYDRVNEINTNAFITIAIRVALIKKYTNSKSSIYPEEIEFLLKGNASRLKDYIDFLIIKLGQNSSFDLWFRKWSCIIEENRYNLLPVIEETNELKIIQSQVDKYLLNYDNSSISDLMSTLATTNINDDILFGIYSHVINEYLKFCSRNIKILRRNSQTGKPTFNSQDICVDLFVDPCGGTFVIGEKNRQKYLTLRIKFIRLLTHLSSLKKKEYMVKILT